ncbi:DUF1127 domain-containing protein [Pannonibacter carbonis]|uniref:DUF1127 domain-containing protein n=1 Tax=Pannonibacter carbonis TaxID=2067569 RepID=UPI00130068BE|nr:DUF1127 domain-containing protein [Pannonibacter carbonis]
MHAGQDTAQAHATPGHAAGIRTLMRLLLDRFRCHLKIRRAQRELSALDARMLKDIGLMRGDDGRWQIDRAGAEPLQRHRTSER